MTARIACVLMAGVLWLGPAGSAAAQVTVEPPEAASDFARGRRLLQEGDYVTAAQVFEQLAGLYPQSPSLPVFVFHRSKANYYAANYAKGIAGFSFFLSRFPDAPEIPHAHFYLANSYYRRGDLDRALRQYLQAYRSSQDERLTRLARQSVVSLLRNAGSIAVGPNDFQNMPEGRRCALIEEVAEILVGRGQGTTARDLASGCGITIAVEAGEASDGASDRETLEIAMLLPMSGDLQEFGNEIYSGAVIGATVSAEAIDQEIVLVPYDTKGYLIDAARIISDLTYGSADAAIGPLTSEAAAVASARLHRADLPLVIPAATEAGLTRLSETSFQLSPNIELQAVRMADYAIEVLEARTAAVMAPTSSEHLRMAERFTERFTQRGGTVAAAEYYRTRDRDFGPYVLDIKGTILGAIPDSSFWLDERGDTVDVDGIPAAVDVIYMPGSSEQIRLLLPQVRFYNLRGRYLGSDAWGDESIYRLGDDVTREAVFPSPFLPSPPNDESVLFAAAYDHRFGGQPGRLARLGFDAVRMVTWAVEQGARTREEIFNLMTEINRYNGASGVITIGENRENVHMPLFRIIDGAAVPLDAAPPDQP